METETLRKFYINELESFINEIQLSFEYIPDSVSKALDKYVKSMKSDDKLFGKETDYMSSHLECYKTEMEFVVNSKGKVKSESFNFLNKIRLFNNTLHFNVFNDENKNTKKTIVKNLYKVYKNTSVYKSVGQQSSDLMKTLGELTAHTQQPTQTQPTQQTQQTQPIDEPVQFPSMDQLKGIPGLGGIFGDGGGVFEELMATTLETLRSSNADPMTMVTNILQGNTNDPTLVNLMESVNNHVKSKLDSGRMTEQDLVDTMTNTMTNVQETLSSGGAGNIQDILSSAYTQPTEEQLRMVMESLNKTKNQKH